MLASVALPEPLGLFAVRDDLAARNGETGVQDDGMAGIQLQRLP